MNENEFDFYFAGINWGECFDILSPYQKRLDYDFETMNTIKFLVVFFSLGYSIYFGSIFFDALYQIQDNRLQTYSEILNQ